LKNEGIIVWVINKLLFVIVVVAIGVTGRFVYQKFFDPESSSHTYDEQQNKIDLDFKDVEMSGPFKDQYMEGRPVSTTNLNSTSAAMTNFDKKGRSMDMQGSGAYVSGISKKLSSTNTAANASGLQ